MSRTDCAREQDVLEAMEARRWPDRCDAALRAHVATCTLCADVIEVAGALMNDHELAWREARVPGSGLVWWRAQIRAREEAARAAAHPMTLVQAVALASVAAGAVALLGATFTWLQAWTGWLRALAPAIDIGAIDLPTLDLGAIGVLGVTAFVERAVPLALAVWLVLAPVAVYLAVADD